MTTRLKCRSPYTALRQLLRTRGDVKVWVMHKDHSLVERVRFVSALQSRYRQTFGVTADQIDKTHCVNSCFHVNRFNYPRAHMPIINAMEDYDGRQDLTVVKITTHSGKTVLWERKP